jgi:hypothetical protein
MFRLLCWKSCALVWAAAALVSIGLGAMESRAQPIPLPITDSPWGFVTVLKTHAADDALSVTMDTALAGCDSGTVYATIPDAPGQKLHHALLLGAFLNHKHVSITTQGCIDDAHRILRVAVRDD